MTIDNKSIPDEWDLYPNVYRALLDGAKLTIPTQAELDENHARVVPAEDPIETADEMKKMAELHPHLWKVYNDIKDKLDKNVPVDFDLYPNVFREFKAGHVTRAPTDQEKEEIHKNFKPEKAEPVTAEFYPAVSRQ